MLTNTVSKPAHTVPSDGGRVCHTLLSELLPVLSQTHGRTPCVLYGGWGCCTLLSESRLCCVVGGAAVHC